MGPAQRYREFVADLAPHRAWLREPQMVGISGASSADETGLRCNELKVGFVAKTAHLANCNLSFVDFGGNSFSGKMCRSRRVVIDGWLRGERRRTKLFGYGLN